MGANKYQIRQISLSIELNKETNDVNDQVIILKHSTSVAAD